MNRKIDIKYVYLNSNFEIVDGNREFYVYFEKVGSELKKLNDFTAPSHINSLKKFLQSKNKKNKYNIFKFKKNQNELKYNIVTAYESHFNGTDTVCLKLIDIDQTLGYVQGYKLEDFELRNALSITSDCIFSYWQSSNVIKITQFHRAKRQVLYEQDIDIWHDECLTNGIVPQNQKEAFDFFVEELKSCPRDIDTSLVCAFRTANPNVLENLSFTGVRFVDDEELMLVGRILPEEDKEQAKHAKKIIEELQIDPLTKVYNKKTITAYAEKIINEKRDDNIALCIVDLDHFKPVNDAYGHLAGDKVLTKTGEILKEVVGDQGFVGRYGGDEFLIIINGMNSEIILRGFLHSIMIKIKDAFAGRYEEINITCSIGCALYPKNGDTYNELFRKADFCLYRAKDKGRNRYVFFRDDLHDALYQKAIEATAGVKYDDREIQELKYMSEFMQDLAINKDTAVSEVVKHMIETYNLDNVSIYYGKELKRIRSFGKSSPLCNYARYAHTECFKKLLAGRTHFRVDFMGNLPDLYEEFREEMNDRSIKSTVQCILGTPDNIKGLITFNRTKESSLWAEYEVNCAAMFAAAINLVPPEEKE